MIARYLPAAFLVLGACGRSEEPFLTPPPPMLAASTESAAPTTAQAAGQPERVPPVRVPPPPGAAAAPNPNGPTRPTVQIPAGPKPTTLQTQDLVVGTGAEARTGSTVDVQYVGVAWSTQREFDASWNRGGAPFSFPLGQGRVIRGWDQGVAGMKVGGRRRITIPPDLGYGERGAGADIGPNETLVFVVDLVAVH